VTPMNELFRVKSSLCELDSTRLSNIVSSDSGAKWIRGYEKLSSNGFANVESYRFGSVNN